MKDKYSGSTTLSERRVLKIVECFALDIPSLKTAALCRVNKNTAHRYYNLLRRRVIELAVAENKPLFGEIEVDESYFGPRRVRGKRGRGAAKKVPLIGLLKRGDCVYVKPVSSWLQRAIAADHQRPGGRRGNHLHRWMARL